MHSLSPNPVFTCRRFIRVLDCEDKIVEYNQEACRVVSFNGGKKSLIRSFPSKLARIPICSCARH